MLFITSNLEKHNLLYYQSKCKISMAPRSAKTTPMHFMYLCDILKFFSPVLKIKIVILISARKLSNFNKKLYYLYL
jgi:hypothetical protein